MPLRMGANGLNLTQANHVVFMEPITEMSVFAQVCSSALEQRQGIRFSSTRLMYHYISLFFFEYIQQLDLFHFSVVLSGSRTN